MPTLLLEENPPLPSHHSSPTPPQSSESADADTRENLGISHQRRESILVPACRATARAVPVPGAASDAGSRLFLKLHHGQPAGRPIRHLFFIFLFVCLFVCLSVIASTFPLYDVLDHTNHTFSESSWSKDI